MSGLRDTPFQATPIPSTRFLWNRLKFPAGPQFSFVMELAKPWSIGSVCSSPPAAHGVASLVFDYSGYGKSKGRLHWEQFEMDAIAAFGALKERVPDLPLTVLGFSLGSGVAAAMIHRVGAKRLILCEAFTSFRHAAASVGIPRPLKHFVPPIWNAQPPLARCKMPVLIVHGEKDRLFPIAMAHELAGWCEPRAEVIVVPNTKHNQPFHKPHISYWGPIVEWLMR